MLSPQEDSGDGNARPQAKLPTFGGQNTHNCDDTFIFTIPS
jgi:hypothetical protein